MRFTTFIVSGALAAVAIAQSATTSAEAPKSSVQICLDSCKSGDVNCQAHCITVPSPDTQNIENTHKCVADCPQGNGSPAETEKYSNCVQGCIKQNYYVSGEGTPNSTGGSDKGSNVSGSDSAPTATGASPTGSASGTRSGSGSQTTGSGSESGTQTGTGASATKTGAASGLTVGSSGAFVGALAALLAL